MVPISRFQMRLPHLAMNLQGTNVTDMYFKNLPPSTQTRWGILFVILYFVGLGLKWIVIRELKRASDQNKCSRIAELLFHNHVVNLMSFFTGVFQGLAIGLHQPLSTWIGSWGCHVFDVLAVFTLLQTAIDGTGIAIYRFLYIFAHQFLKFKCGEKTMSRIIICGGIMLCVGITILFKLMRFFDITVFAAICEGRTHRYPQEVTPASLLLRKVTYPILGLAFTLEMVSYVAIYCYIFKHERILWGKNLGKAGRVQNRPNYFSSLHMTFLTLLIKITFYVMFSIYVRLQQPYHVPRQVSVEVAMVIFPLASFVACPLGQVSFLYVPKAISNMNRKIFPQ